MSGIKHKDNLADKTLITVLHYKCRQLAHELIIVFPYKCCQLAH
jgi:hypothetical protein